MGSNPVHCIAFCKASVEEAKDIWRSADAVCFDVDSTVIQEEGLDELACYCGKGREVKEL
ncbi:Phosphoserine phosphatase, chloroplastic [Portunus trituberculatus]|uniref:Phosphoserine phosphatase n=1 Tax=Portunus trituberculatus TaxID=210409 RepID=A0A5B7K015_PORTR|nr:Phosphoserine phosphatase, chloroplastic [Portunus trituberculatus]